MHYPHCGYIRDLLRLILLSILLVFTVSVTADSKSALQNFGKGILWRIDAANIAPSYLFGTIHSDDPRVTSLPKPVEQAFKVSTQFVLEIAMSITPEMTDILRTMREYETKGELDNPDFATAFVLFQAPVLRQ